MNLRCAQALAAFVLLVCLVPACREAQQDPPSPTSEAREVPKRSGRVLVIGIDGATMRILEPLLEEGRVPNLAKLAAEGASGPLRSIKPILSPRIWTTIATGKDPDDHGILAWVTPEKDGEPSRLFTSLDRRVHALWNIVSQADISVGTVNWLVTYPPEPIRGVMVTDHALPSGAESKRFMQQTFGAGSGDVNRPETPVTLPAEWQARVEAELMNDAQLTSIPNPFKTGTIPIDIFRDRYIGYYEQDDVLARIALRLEEEESPDILMLLLQGIDRSSHFFWGGFEPPDIYPPKLKFTPEEREGARRVLHTYYEYTDALIGKLLERYGPDDLVLVLSDHGFEGGVTWNVMTGVHHSDEAIDGVIFARGPRVRQGPAGAVNVKDITPTILAWLGLPVADDMDGAPAPFLEPRPDQPPNIPTYETKPVPRLEAGAESGAEEQYIEQLRELGYVE